MKSTNIPVQYNSRTGASHTQE